MCACTCGKWRAGDQTAKLWNVKDGQCYFTYELDAPCRASAFSVCETMALISSDAFMGSTPAISLVNIAADPAEQTGEVVRTYTGFTGRISRVTWGRLNKYIISAGEDGIVRKWDVETGKVIAQSDEHTKMVMSLEMSADRTHFVTASQDCTAKLWDPDTLQVLKTYKTERPVNAAYISPLFDHVVLGGGQDASQVTTTSSRAGGFQARFFHKVLEREFASVKGHFGPINTIAITPDGRSYASGGEEGYIRLHHFDPEYFVRGYE